MGGSHGDQGPPSFDKKAYLVGDDPPGGRFKIVFVVRKTSEVVELPRLAPDQDTAVKEAINAIHGNFGINYLSSSRNLNMDFHPVRGPGRDGSEDEGRARLQQGEEGCGIPAGGDGSGDPGGRMRALSRFVPRHKVPATWRRHSRSTGRAVRG